MPISNRILVSAHSFNQNASFVKQAIADLSDDEWLRRPNDHTNHMLWLVCHIAWARTMLLKRLGGEWTTEWMHLYGRGAKCADTPECPSPSVALEAWNEACTRLNAALEAASDDLLDMPAPTPGPPSADGKISGTVDFMAYHETYHVGQAAYLRSWLGHAGVMG
jgi:uncharacterized damage-inducible protein DinB